MLKFFEPICINKSYKRVIPSEGKFRAREGFIPSDYVLFTRITGSALQFAPGVMRFYPSSWG